jgi:aspartate aminotransferase-like enzyme
MQPMTKRVTQAVKAVVEESRKPLPKWVGVAGVTMVAVGAVGHDHIVTTFGGGEFGKWFASFIVVFGGALSTLARALGSASDV